ncbi:MAG: hypothetical protein NUW23_07350 [Firmicutes bacterium]|nr:hypothetical protein [Bacillota bacterium]
MRQAARLLAISKNTAFAWRHKVISRLAGAHARTTLSGIVETHQLLVLECYKGSPAEARRAHAMSRKPGSRQISFLSPRSDRVYVLFALDRFGNVAAELVPGESRVGFDEIMRDRIAPGTRVCVERGIGHWPTPGRRSLKLTWTTSSRARAYRGDMVSADPMHRQRNAKRLAVHFQAWLMRFRGGAMKYLLRYIYGCKAAAPSHLEQYGDLEKCEALRGPQAQMPPSRAGRLMSPRRSSTANWDTCYYPATRMGTSSARATRHAPRGYAPTALLCRPGPRSRLDGPSGDTAGLQLKPLGPRAEAQRRGPWAGHTKREREPVRSARSLEKASTTQARTAEIKGV